MAYDFERPLNVIMPELEGLIRQAQADLAAAQADLAKPIVYFTAATIRVAEGDVGTNTITLTARRSGLSGTLLVPAAYIPGSAAPADFPDGLPGAKTFTFVDGSDTATVSIVARSNTDIEVDKTFGYRLATGVGYRLGAPSSTLVSILNDDTSTSPITLGALTLSGTLTAGTASSGTILGATAGSTVAESIVGLSIDSDDRTYAWDGTGGVGTFAGGMVETHPNATNSGRASPVTIVAAPPATVVSIDSIVRRSGQDYTFTARRSGDISKAATRTINVKTSTDYPPGSLPADWPNGSFPSVTVTFPAGSATVPFTITAPVAAQPE